MYILGLLKKSLKIMVRKLYEFPYKLAHACSTTLFTFRVLGPALSRFIPHVVKILVFFSQTAPDPSKNGRKRLLSSSLPLRGLAVVWIIWFFPRRLLLLRKRRGSGVHYWLPSFSHSPQHICFSIQSGGWVPQTLLFTASAVVCFLKIPPDFLRSRPICTSVGVVGVVGT